MSKNIHDTLHEYKRLITLIVIFLGAILVLTTFFVWEHPGEAQTSRTFLFDSGTNTFTADGNLIVNETLSGLSPLKLADDVEFVDSEDNVLYRIFVRGESAGARGASLSTDLNEALIIETVDAQNANFMHLAFFDNIRKRPSLVLNTGTSTRASVFENSLMVGVGSTTIDADYSKCVTHGALSIDCDTAATGGDLFVKDDVEIGGDLFVQGTIHKPMAKVTKSTNQSISQNTLTMVTWDEEKYDTDDMHSTSTNNTRITFNTAGVYSVLAQSEWGINSGGFRFLDIMKNGVSVARSRDLAENASEHNVAFVGEFEVNDYIELQVFQDTGGNLDFESGAIIENTYLEAHKID